MEIGLKTGASSGWFLRLCLAASHRDMYAAERKRNESIFQFMPILGGVNGALPCSIKYSFPLAFLFLKVYTLSRPFLPPLNTELYTTKMAGRDHVLALPSFVLRFRIFQLVTALAILGLSAYGITFLSFDGIDLTLFSVRPFPSHIKQH